MNSKAKKIMKNIKYAVSANFVVLGISVLLNMFVPKILGVTEYSYWQLYVFYTSYVGFFHLGWLDGIYLKIGGQDYDELNKNKLGNQFWYLFMYEILLTVLVLVLISLDGNFSNKTLIQLLTIVSSIVINVKSFILFIFQGTNRIKEYANLSKNDRYLYCILLVTYLLFGGRSFLVLILFDIISKSVITFWYIYVIKDLINVKIQFTKQNIFEVIDNIKVGSNLMISNIAGMLIIGITRLFVEINWDIRTFGKLSFTLSISNMFMTFINAVGVVMFPILRRTRQDKLISLFKSLRQVFVVFSFGLLIFFVPVKIILSNWLPAYSESLNYMGILFPMVIYEGRMSLLLSTYLKNFRKERLILLSNLVSLILSVILASIAVFIFNSMIMTVVCIIICIIVRCLCAEFLLTKYLEVNILKNVFQELALTCLFIIGNILFSNILSLILYFIFYIIFVFLNRFSLKNSVNYLLRELK
ncbi:hypothetical protein ABXL94_03480 [Enterococcus gallinarum]|uniref:lipopolysaccharide biosynthesis protein n=1 Tax=Enterococcus gallinarum TaxID=1353 RepID=UPI00338EB550